MSTTPRVGYRVYRPNRTAHVAILWTGDNLDEARRFIRDTLGEDAGGYCRFYDEPDEHLDPALDKVFQFYDGDDEEVDPGRWIVVEIGPPAWERVAEIMTAEEFEAAYGPSGEVAYFGGPDGSAWRPVEAIETGTAGTSGGVELSDDVIARLVDEAETGYDVAKLRPAPGALAVDCGHRRLFAGGVVRVCIKPAHEQGPHTDGDVDWFHSPDETGVCVDCGRQCFDPDASETVPE